MHYFYSCWNITYGVLSQKNTSESGISLLLEADCINMSRKLYMQGMFKKESRLKQEWTMNEK